MPSPPSYFFQDFHSNLPRPDIDRYPDNIDPMLLDKASTRSFDRQIGGSDHEEPKSHEKKYVQLSPGTDNIHQERQNQPRQQLVQSSQASIFQHNPAYPHPFGNLPNGTQKNPQKSRRRPTRQAHPQVRSPPKHIKSRSLGSDAQSFLSTGQGTPHNNEPMPLSGVAQRSSKAKFSPEQLSCMESWYTAHIKTPYPSADEKGDIANQTRLSVQQVDQWFCNKRKRSLKSNGGSVQSSVRLKSRPKNTSTPTSVTLGYSEGSRVARTMAVSESGGLFPIDVPLIKEGRESPVFTQGLHSRESSSSLETWKSMDPRDGPAPFQSINLQDNDQPPSFQTYNSRNTVSDRAKTMSTSALNSQQATTHEVLRSVESQVSLTGNDSEEPSPRKKGKQGKLIVSNWPAERQGDSKFQCTFCNKGFLTSERSIEHEKRSHGPRNQYICMFDGPLLKDDERWGKCAFCGLLDPSEEHLSQEHNILPCSQEEMNRRTFSRLDSLQNHMRRIHKASSASVPPSWVEPIDIHEHRKRFYCGFCRVMLNSIRERNAHVAEHFDSTDEIFDMTRWTHYKETGFSQSLFIAEADMQDDYNFGVEAFLNLDPVAAT